MRWPSPSGTSTDANRTSTSTSNPNPNSDDDDEALTSSRSAHLDRGVRVLDIPSLGWTHFADPVNIASTLILTAVSLGAISGYRTYLRRIPVASRIQEGVFRRRGLLGRVTSVGDGDNFRLFHTPGGRLAGWGWLPGRHVPARRDLLKDRTIHVRLAGVDAPELAHFGRPPQPYAAEALAWLRRYVLGRRVRAYVYKRDQYDRAVATVYVWKGLLRRDVGLQMIRQGLATVYEAKTGAEFGEVEDKYRKAEWWARTKRKGMWAATAAGFESPRDYKTRMASPDDKAHVKR